MYTNTSSPYTSPIKSKYAIIQEQEELAHNFLLLLKATIMKDHLHISSTPKVSNLLLD